MSREKKDAEVFDSIADKYALKDKTPSSSMARQYQIWQAVQPILEHSGNLGTIVDIGCGTAAVARYLKGHYKHYIGIDQSDKMIESARSVNQDIPDTTFISENIKLSSIQDNTADTILSIGALHHIADLDKAMASIKRIAKQDAYFLAIEPQKSNPVVQVLRKIRMIFDSGYSRDQIYFLPQGLKNLLASHNIKILSLEYQGFFTAPFAQVIMNPQFLFAPLSRCAVSLDRLIKMYAPAFFKKLSFNIVIIGRIQKIKLDTAG